MILRSSLRPAAPAAHRADALRSPSRARRTGLALALALTAAFGCSSSDTTPRYRVLASPLAAATIEVPGGPTVVVPAGAVTSETWITATVPSGRAPRNTVAVASPLRLGPEGQTFDKPVEITMPIEPSALPAGSTIDDVVVMRAPQGSDAFVPLPTRRSGGSAVAAVTEHFSDFVAVVYEGAPPECGNRTCGANETCDTCPGDCGLCATNGPICGDATCGLGETCADCAYDCGACPSDPVAAVAEQVIKWVTDQFVLCQGDETGRASFEADARSFFRERFAAERLAAGTIAFDPARAQQCLAALEAWPDCSFPLSRLIGLCLVPMSHGIGASDSECNTSLDCAEGLFCEQLQDASPCAGVCKSGAKAAPGERCHDVSDCAPSATPGHLVTCDVTGVGYRVCIDTPPPVSALALGASCARPTDEPYGPITLGCGAGLVCFGAGRALSDREPIGTCQSLIPTGEVCMPLPNGGGSLCREEVADCYPEVQGGNNYRCFATTLNVGLGDACDLDDSAISGRGKRQCDVTANLTCGMTGVCELAGDGTLAALCNSDAHCNTGLACIQGRCARFVAEGQGCGPIDQTGDYCLSGSCNGEIFVCDPPGTFVSTGGPEICDNYDNDCNGVVDEGFTTQAYFYDDDNDGYYATGAGMVQACMQHFGLASVGGDCDPTNGGVNPGVVEVPNNGIDDDCNATTMDSLCGDATCDAASPYFENPINCPGDCPDVCGDGLCSGIEDNVTCSSDCP